VKKQGKSLIRCECPVCFLVWEEESKKARDNIVSRLCELCSKIELTERQLLERRINHLDKTLVYRYPEIIQHMYKQLVLKDL
jgi:hypothetical protein